MHDEYLVERGSERTIEYAVCSNGTVPAQEFVEGLTVAEQTKLAVLFKRMADTGRIFNEQQFKHVDGKIYEFKRDQIRVGCFQVGRRWILTHGFVKKSQKWKKTELDRANRIMDEHLEREAKERRK